MFLFNKIKKPLRLVIIVALLPAIFNPSQSKADDNVKYFDKLIYSYYLATQYPDIIEFKDWGYLVKLENGKEVELRNSDQSFISKQYLLSEIWQEPNRITFAISQGYQVSHKIIKLENGESKYLDGYPNISPDKSQFVTIDNRYEGEYKIKVYNSRDFEAIDIFSGEFNPDKINDGPALYYNESFCRWEGNNKILVKSMVFDFNHKDKIIQNNTAIFTINNNEIEIDNLQSKQKCKKSKNFTPKSEYISKLNNEDIKQIKQHLRIDTVSQFEKYLKNKIRKK